MRKLYIVIAAYNESSSILKVIDALCKVGYTNIVITDDGSKDDTFFVISSQPVYALRHIINRGQGAALKTGIDFALSQGAEYIITFDADGQHRVEDIPAILEPVKSGEYDVTLGSRFLKKGTSMPLTRYLTLKVGVLVQGLFYGLFLTDAHNGFRCFSRKAAQEIDIRSDRMEHASEIIEEIKRNRLRYKEVPVIIRYTDETLRKGHGGIGQAFRVLREMIMHKLTR
ncbi:MAG: glycosyltransferase family 2 protein [Nanoarchaeota archaeon]